MSAARSALDRVAPPDGLLERYQRAHGASPADSEVLFGELVRFLASAAGSEASLVPSAVVDELWHEAILDTATYRVLCANVAGTFLDHEPAREHDPSLATDYAATRRLMLGAGEDRMARDRFWPADGAAAGRCSCRRRRADHR